MVEATKTWQSLYRFEHGQTSILGKICQFSNESWQMMEMVPQFVREVGWTHYSRCWDYAHYNSSCMGQSINVYIQHQLYDWAEDGFICFHMYIYCIQTQETCLKLWVHTFPMLWIFLWVRYSTLEKDIGFQFVYRPFGVDIQNIWMTYGSMDWFKGKS